MAVEVDEATGSADGRRAVRGGPRVPVVPVQGDTRLAHAAAGAVPAFGRTLRVSLAMRGGVSLAVWIGGAVAELDLFRRIRVFERDEGPVAYLLTPGDEPPTAATLERAEVYAELLWLTGYDQVEFDLLAGTSAGGLNAVVYAVAQRAGASLDALRGMWSGVGGLWGLLQLPGHAEIRALMRGEDLFRREVHLGLRDIYGCRPSHPDLVATQVDIDLSATAIDAREELEPDSSEGRAHFRFRSGVETGRTNRIPSRHDAGADRDDDDLSLERLALAARATSSLPGGFEPAEVASPVADGTTRSTDRDDLHHAFSGHRDPVDLDGQPRDVPYRIVDGAVFDNVPIERAMRAARARASDRNADRVLLFLDPDPDPGPDDELVWDDGASKFFRALRAQFTRMFRQEPVSRETAEVQRFNAERRVDEARRRAAVSLVESAGWSRPQVDARRAAYVRSLGAVVSERLAEAISGPSLWQVSTDLPHRHRYLPIARTRLIAFTELVVDDYATAAASAEPMEARLGSASALADAANCVLAWVRDLERVPEAAGSRRFRAFPHERAHAYAALETAVAHGDRATARVLERVRRFVHEAHPKRLAQPTPETARPWMQEWREADAGDAGIARAHASLDHCVRLLLDENDRLRARMGELDEDEVEAVQRSPWLQLQISDATPRAVDLAALLCPAGIPPALSSVRYWSIGVDERPDSPEAFTALVDGQRRAALQEALRAPADRVVPRDLLERLTATGEAATLTPQSKLAGYGLGNFLGFLSASWRVNDWLWGRMDAAAGAVRFFDAVEPNRVDASAAIRTAQDAILHDADRDGEVIAPADCDWSPAEPLRVPPVVEPSFRGSVPVRERLRGGVDALGDLPPGYLVGIASRGLRLIDRAALRPGGTLLRSIVGFVLGVLRPVLAVLPTVIDPPRAAAIAGVVGGAGWLLTWRAFESFSWGLAITALVVVALLVVWLVAAAGGADARWRGVREDAAARAPGGAAAAERIDAAARESRQAATAPVFRALAAIGVAGFAILAGNLLMSLLAAGTAVVLVVAAMRACTAVVRPAPRATRARAVAGSTTLVVLAGGVPFVLQASGAADAAEALALFAPGDVAPWWAPLAVLGLAASVVSVLLLAGWLPPFWRREWARPVELVWVTAAAALAGGLAWLAVAAAVVLLGGGDPFALPGLQAAAFLVAWGNLLWWAPAWAGADFSPDDTPRRPPARTE